MGLQQTEPLTINLMYLILILLWLDSDKAFLETTTVFLCCGPVSCQSGLQVIDFPAVRNATPPRQEGALW